jgi:hypothetical protein
VTTGRFTLASSAISRIDINAATLFGRAEVTAAFTVAPLF